MSDADTGAERADESARDADNKTDEQVWADIESREKADAKPEDDHDEGIEPEPVEAAGEAEPDPEPSDDPTASTDDGDGADGEAKPAGMDPEELEAQNKRLEQSFRSDQGRLKALQRKTTKLQRQIAAADLRPQRSDRDETILKDRRKKVAASREEYGDVIGPVLDEVDALRADNQRRDERDAEALRQQRVEFDEIVAVEEAVFEDEHPDGFDLIVKNRKVFDGWIDDQPRALRDIYAANQQVIVDGTAASYLVGLFKEALLDAEGDQAPANHESEKLQTRRQRQLAGARSIRSTGRQEASSRPAADSEDAQAHWDYFERLDRE